MTSPHVPTDREQRLLILVDQSITLAEAEYGAEQRGDISTVRVEQYEMILRNLKALRFHISSGKLGCEPAPGGFSRFADERGPLSEDLMTCFHRFEAILREERQ